MYACKRHKQTDGTGREGGDPNLSLLYFLFCIIENLGDLTDMPNSIFCKFSIFESSRAQRRVRARWCRVCVGACAGVCVRVVTLLNRSPPLQVWQFWVFPGRARARGRVLRGHLCADLSGKVRGRTTPISLTHTHALSPHPLRKRPGER